jgi:hypothetical protein
MARTVHFVLLVADVLSGSAASAVATASRQNSMQLHALAQFPIPKAVAGGAPRRRRSAGGHPLFPLRHTRRTSAARAHRRSLPGVLRCCQIISHGLVATATPHRRRDSMAWRLAAVRWASAGDKPHEGRSTGARTMRNSRSSAGVILFRSRCRHRQALPLFPCAQLEILRATC